ncbi:hypothetical protein AB4Z10_20690 [Bosea sp. RAF48]|uniref:hypothetical protein n=1 Tax=Bosea sp. RAF48 TaxID=3237480 RepID=UPI003F922100
MRRIVVQASQGFGDDEQEAKAQASPSARRNSRPPTALFHPRSRRPRSFQAGDLVGPGLQRRFDVEDKFVRLALQRICLRRSVALLLFIAALGKDGKGWVSRSSWLWS